MMKRRIDGRLVDLPLDEEWKIRSSVVPDGSSGPLLENHGAFDVVMSNEEAEELRKVWAAAPKPPPMKIVRGDEFLSRFTDEEYAALRKQEADNTQIARWIECFRLRGDINVLSDTNQKAKAEFVSLGVFSQERADEIFN